MNITIKDVIAKVNKSSSRSNWNAGSWDFIEMFQELSGLYVDSAAETTIQETLKIYHVPGATWICTDTWVGISVMYFKDIPVAVIFQSARKSDKEIKWLDSKIYSEFLSFMWSLHQPREVCDVIEESDTVDERWFESRFDYNNRVCNIDL